MIHWQVNVEKHNIQNKKTQNKMKVLKPIDSKYFVSIDIETVRISDNFDDLPELFQDAWAHKNKQNGEIPTNEELADLWKKTSSLYAEFSKICAISFAFLNDTGEILFCKGIASEDEKEVLTEAYHFLNRISMGSPKYRLIGHATNYFDYPFMCKRYVINGIEIPKILDDTDKKPWEKLNQCTNTLWKMGCTGPGSSLQALCVALDIPISKVDMVGDEVGREFFKGNILGIKDYCNKDVIATFNVLRRFKYESIFTFEDVVYIDEAKTEEVSTVQTPPLEELFTTKEFTDDVKLKIKESILSKKVTKKEWEMLELLVRDCYLQNEMFKADSKPIQDRKSEEVSKFFNQLKEEYNAKK